MLSLSTELRETPGIPPRFLPKLARLGLTTVRDLLWHFPIRYEDFSNIYTIEDLIPHQDATITAEIVEVKSRRTWRRSLYLLEATLADGTGEIRATWFNQPYLKHVLVPGRVANFSGKVSVSRTSGERYLANPTYELASSHTHHDTTHTARIVPVYPETKGLTSKGIRFLIAPLLKAITPPADPLPAHTLARHVLPSLVQALRAVHFPDTIEQALAAKRRFAFEDLFFLQLVHLKTRRAVTAQQGIAIDAAPEAMRRRLSTLPFTLTLSQKKVLWEILTDMARPHPMHRLLQGDVGSGKTIVAGLAAIHAAEAGYQVAFMAPTELLARQHFETLTRVFHAFEGGIALVTAHAARAFYGHALYSKQSRESLRREIARGSISLILGTHALLSQSLTFPTLALVVVDEQHRFGVAQRAALVSEKPHAGKRTRAATTVPHFLSMSATPIPRTLALSLFGDLDLSLITELPKDRKLVITKAFGPQERDEAYAFVRREVAAGHQVFVICSRIDPPGITPEELSWEERSTLEVKSVTEEYDRLRKKVFPVLRLGMLHGRLKPAEKERVMRDFTEHRLDMLVATSVVEVGVDVPNATIMLIEGAERFGLAQLHQFRGRVGRSEHQSYCFLMSDTITPGARARLKAVVEARNGFELAEHDLKLRGPGQFLGTAQSGFPDLAMQAIQNPGMVKDAREAAEEVLTYGASVAQYGALRERLKEFEERLHGE
jgi:ATP-dependent DNA helicase RecG